MYTNTAMRSLEARLAADGFTPQQIARLQALRATYPIIELVQLRRELDQLRFLRWRHATGRLDA